MSIPSQLGLLAFVAVFTSAGAGVLTAIRGTQPHRSWLGDIGLAYLVGIASLGAVLTLEVILGLPLSLGSILCTAAVLAVGGVAVGRRRTTLTSAPMPSSGRVDYVAAAGLAVLTLLVLLAYFRSARLHGLYGWDAGSFWVPKAVAIFSTGGLEPGHFTTLPGPSYPPLIPVLQATSFHFMGEVDVVALHLLYWSLLAGFVGAAVRLLAPLARPALAWAGVLALIVADQIGRDALTPQADVLMDLLLGLGVLCIACWLLRGDPGLYAGALVFLAAAALTKREALLLCLCAAGATFVATRRRLRSTWLPCVMIVVIPFLATVPWRIWFTRRSLPGDGPESGPLGLLDNLGRLWPSTSLVLETLSDPGIWSVILVVVVLAVVAAFLCGERTIASFAIAYLALSTLGFVWIMWSFPSLPLTQVGSLNPIPRTVGAALVPLGLLVPILLTEVASRTRIDKGRSGVSPRLRTVTLGSAALVVLAYPAAVLAMSGAPRFPSRDDCAALADPPVDGGFVAVYDRAETLSEASELRDGLIVMGFTGTEVRADGCGKWEVANPLVETVDQARGHAADAERAGFVLRLERP